MTKISKIVAAASALGMLGIAVLPVASYAAVTDTVNTNVEVTITEECLIGEGTNMGSGQDLALGLSVAVPSKEITASGAESSIDVVCNATWNLSEMAGTATLTLGVPGGPYGGAVGFNTWSTGAAPADFAANTWSIKYAGTGVVAAAQEYRSVPTTATVIASGVATAKTSIVQTFGAKTDGSVAQGTYGTVMTYTLATP